MGMSASQARYLSLTARKSDLEFRGQQINQSRLMLSNQSANLYSSMLTMSVPTPPVETDFMKDVYTFSMGGDNTTLSSYKLSMGKDGYGYDILYSKPATTKQLTASSVSDVQRAINRYAKNGVDNSSNIKIKVGYKNSDGEETFTANQSPKVNRMVQMSGNTATSSTSVSANEKNFFNNNFEFSTDHTGRLYEQLKKSVDFRTSISGDTIKKEDITVDNQDKKKLNYDGKQLTQLSTQQLANWFGGEGGDTNDTYKAEGGLLEAILGKDSLNFNQNATNDKNQSGYQIFMDKNGDIYVFKSNKGISASNITTIEKTTQNIAAFNAGIVSEVKKYKLTDILGLHNDADAVDDKSNTLYYTDLYTGENADQATDRVYFSNFSFDGNNLSFSYAAAKQNYLGVVESLNGHSVTHIDDTDKLKKLGIIKAENENEDGTDKKAAITYNYYMDKDTGDVWRQKITTSTSGRIVEEWGLYKAQKTASIGDKEAELIDEKDWPIGIERSVYSSGNYDCYYVPDETGTGGSYYLVSKNDKQYDLSKITGTEESVTFSTNRSYAANNTYKIEGLTACVVSNDNIPSTILDAYDKDNYIVYATYNDKDTDFSDPVKYYVFPKDDDAANAVCSYAYEKSYTGKNELLQARANILVDENGRLSKIDILNQGTYALEYGQEKDEDAYNEAYREYEYKLQKYEQEMSAIDAKTALIQQQDKKLELQLKSIDTEHSAIQTELEALKKVIDTNIKSSFGTFGG